jgi:uncharacterized repeat protein (TIGR04002 family)
MTAAQRQHQLLLRLCLTALLAALTTVFTAYIGHFPLPGEAGYLHFGDSLIFLAACLLPTPYAMAVGMIGGGLADLLTYPVYFIFTVVIKALLTVPFRWQGPKIITLRNVLSLLPAYAVSAGGYFLAEGIISRWDVAFVKSLLGSLIQIGGSAVVFVALGLVMDRLGLKRRLSLF